MIISCGHTTVVIPYGHTTWSHHVVVRLFTLINIYTTTKSSFIARILSRHLWDLRTSICVKRQRLQRSNVERQGRQVHHKNPTIILRGARESLKRGLKWDDGVMWIRFFANRKTQKVQKGRVGGVPTSPLWECSKRWWSVLDHENKLTLFSEYLFRETIVIPHDRHLCPCALEQLFSIGVATKSETRGRYLS